MTGWLINWIINKETIERWIYLLIDWSMERLIDGSIDRSIDWWIDQLMGWLIDWPICWLTDWPTDWPTDWLTDRLTDWLIDWLIAWLIYRFAIPHLIAIQAGGYSNGNAASSLLHGKQTKAVYQVEFTNYNYDSNYGRDNLETITTTSYDVNKIILLTKVLKKFLSAAQQILVSLSISLDTNSMVCLSSRLTSTARAPWK